jgi:hypothetical protein
MVILMSGRSELLNWVSKAQRDFGAYIPKDFPMQMFNSSASDESLYNAAMSLYTIVKSAGYNHSHSNSKEEHPDKKLFYLVPHQEADGSVCYVDRFTNNVVMSLTRQPNGLFSCYGPKEMIELLGGRGLMSQINKDLADGDYFHDKVPEKKR